MEDHRQSMSASILIPLPQTMWASESYMVWKNRYIWNDRKCGPHHPNLTWTWGEAEMNQVESVVNCWWKQRREDLGRMKMKTWRNRTCDIICQQEFDRVKREYFHKSNRRVHYLSDSPPSSRKGFCPSPMAEPVFPRLHVWVLTCVKGVILRLYLVGPRLRKGRPSFSH